MHGDLPTELARQGQTILEGYPGLPHEWKVAGDQRCLIFPQVHPNGFEVSIEAEPNALRVFGLGFHTHFDWHPSAAEAVRDALGMVRDLLSSGMRVRELRAGGRPYRWELQAWDDGEWHTEEVSAQLFWNYFAPRTVQVYQNASLPPRNEPSNER